MAYDHGDHDADDSGAESNYFILCMGKLRLGAASLPHGLTAGKGQKQHKSWTLRRSRLSPLPYLPLEGTGLATLEACILPGQRLCPSFVHTQSSK